MLTNTDITLFNVRMGRRGEEYHKTYISGASWKGKRLTALTEKGLLGEDEISIRIPLNADTEGKLFVSSDIYDGNPDTWTLKAGDWIVLGIFGGEFADMDTNSPNVIQVRNVADNRDSRNSPRMQHWRVIG